MGTLSALRRTIAFFLCLLGTMLPWRLRVLYSEGLGWAVQFLYMNYVYIIKFILKEVGAAGQGAGPAGSGGDHA